MSFPNHVQSRNYDIESHTLILFNLFNFLAKKKQTKKLIKNIYFFKIIF